jgi:hypothetical protein
MAQDRFEQYSRRENIKVLGHPLFAGAGFASPEIVYQWIVQLPLAQF